MPRTCTVCSHSQRAQIDAALVSGTPYRDIAGRFQVSKTAVERHREHIPVAISKSQEAREEAQALDVVKQLQAINGATLAVLKEARASGNPDLALRAIDRIQRQIELQAKLLGDLDDRPQVNILLVPEWLAVRTAILAALLPYPEARQAVVSAVARVGGAQ
ncbi:MAG TPA: hypothetical protein VGF38_01495 [Ktedonobacterales bacterium]|jgi:hypothetical protein